ncbi:hypothetical protein AB8O53_01590 [Streptomyces pilosus]
MPRATAEPGRESRLAKAHPPRLPARRKVSPGSYSLALQVNGCRFPEVAFAVLDACPALPLFPPRSPVPAVARRGPVRAVRNSPKE